VGAATTAVAANTPRRLRRVTPKPDFSVILTPVPVAVFVCRSAAFVQLLPQVHGGYCTTRIKAQASIVCCWPSTTGIGKLSLNGAEIHALWCGCIGLRRGGRPAGHKWRYKCLVDRFVNGQWRRFQEIIEKTAKSLETSVE
jgi:hypothetical protein